MCAVASLIPGDRRSEFGKMDGLATGLVHRLETAGSHCRQQGGPKSGSFISRDRANLRIKNIGLDLSPERAAPAPARSPNLAYKKSHLSKNLKGGPQTKEQPLP